MRRLPRRPASRISRRPEHILFAPVIEMHGKEARAWSDAIVALIPEDGRAEMSFVGVITITFAERMDGGCWSNTSR
ncbi:hypothetical protein I552_2358 [Mycobacterium xenopi 3993]|nr:hypothetical protein I552_2358 [Mycobacterium xenopi 3993]